MDAVPATDEPIHVPTAWDQIVGWFGVPRPYRLTRYVVFRLLGFIYVFAFVGLICQGPALLGSHGLTPVADYVARLYADGVTASDLPSLFMWDASDGALVGWAYVGLAISLAVAAGYANMPMLLLLWVIYGSYERVGQLWFSFGWEIQILETTLIAAFMAHPWDPRPLAAPAPPTTAIVLMRWMTFRIMLGAGLIKIRGDACWRELTCLDAHFETQPIPNPLSAWFHAAPHAVHAGGVVFNHLVELVCPWFVFGPRRLRLIAAIAMTSFQLVLIASGNLAFLNWLTLVPVLACFDDDALRAVLPKRAKAWLDVRLAHSRPARWPHRIACYAFAALVIIKSVDVVENLASSHQAMNRSYDRLELVNTYGAFGSVGDTRHELVIEGTMADDPNAANAEWRAFELPCKPGDVARRPCFLGPYHRRLDWLIWFAAMEDEPRDVWVLHLVWKLLDGDIGVRELMGPDPFDGRPPKWVRIRRFVYRMAGPLADTWWLRDEGEEWLPPLSLDSKLLRSTLKRFGMPSPTLR
jgi:hypothetical protein